MSEVAIGVPITTLHILLLEVHMLSDHAVWILRLFLGPRDLNEHGYFYALLPRSGNDGPVHPDPEFSTKRDHSCNRKVYFVLTERGTQF